MPFPPARLLVLAALSSQDSFLESVSGAESESPSCSAHVSARKESSLSKERKTCLSIGIEELIFQSESPKTLEQLVT